MLRFFPLALLLVSSAALGEVDIRNRSPDPTSVIEDSMCIATLNGQGCLHVDEDVAGLVITVYGTNGALLATYDAATEIEDIAAIGTYAAPSANNVRVSPQGASGADVTQMMLADSLYASQSWITICVSDGKTTIRDFCRQVNMVFDTLESAFSDYGVATESSVNEVGNNVSAVQRGLVPLDTSIATLSSQVIFTLTDGSSDNNAYNNCVASIREESDVTQVARARILDYTGSTKTVRLANDPGIFTMDAGDLVTITCAGR